MCLKLNEHQQNHKSQGWGEVEFDAVGARHNSHSESDYSLKFFFFFVDFFHLFKKNCMYVKFIADPKYFNFSVDIFMIL